MRPLSLQRRLAGSFAMLAITVSVGFAAFVHWRLACVVASDLDAELHRRAVAMAMQCEWEDGAANLEGFEAASATAGMFGDFVVAQLPGRVLAGNAKLLPRLRADLGDGRDHVYGTIDEGDAREQRTLAMLVTVPARAATPNEPEQPAFVVAVLVATGAAAMRAILADTTMLLVGGAVAATLLGILLGTRLRRSIARPLVALAGAAAAAGEGTGSMPRTGAGDEVDRLAATLDQAFARLRAARERERGFAADASHELRTPVAIVRAAAEASLMARDLSPAHRESLDDIRAAAARMATIVDSLLLLARLDAADLAANFTRCDLVEVVDHAVALLAHEAAARSVRVQRCGDETVMVRGEAGLLGILVGNLLRNAIEWSPPGGVVEVRVDRSPPGLAIVDHGAGIHAELLPRVFDRFVRGDAARGRERGGAGLGLALVRAIAECHGGTCGIESRPGGGTTVTVRFG